MDALNELLLGWGWLGLFVSAFLAGTVLPFSSEVVLLACIAGGTPPVAGVAAATAGNALGGMTCYWVGRLGRTEWIARYLRVGPRELARARRFMRGRGAWMAVLSFHFFHTVGMPRLRGERSMMSSCISVKEWNTSRAAAGERISSPKLSSKKE